MGGQHDETHEATWQRWADGRFVPHGEAGGALLNDVVGGVVAR